MRCGYCDFNTYTLTELGVDGASVATYADAALAELDLAVSVLGAGAPAVSTVFVGGGTPTLLAAHDLVRVLDGIRERFGLAPDAEVTTEANPDSVTPESLRVLADGGFTRVSIGMQSAVPSVLATLERTHDPANVRRAVDAARAAGLKVSVDLIYGTPGESMQDWRDSLAAAVALDPTTSRPTRWWWRRAPSWPRRCAAARCPRPRTTTRPPSTRSPTRSWPRRATGWYEVSNWARTERRPVPPQRGLLDRRRAGGASGPARTATSVACAGGTSSTPTPLPPALGAGQSPAAGRELLTDEQRYDELVLLGVRRVDGLDIDALAAAGALGRGRASSPTGSCSAGPRWPTAGWC